MLRVSDAELRALAGGETIVVFVERGRLTEGDEVDLAGDGPVAPATLKPAYRRWAEAGPPDGDLSGVVVSVDPAAVLDVGAGASRHILESPGDGDLVVLRVYDGATPVLGDPAFDAKRTSVEGALRR
jgi:hypothetical protein